MPKQSQKAEVNSFLGGLITEASALNFPPNAASDIQNFELNRDGRITRRLGMDYEDNYGIHFTNYTSDQVDSLAYNTFKWEGVGGDADTNYIVIQVGNQLLFYDADVLNFTQNGTVQHLNLSEFATDVVFSMTSVEGRLIVVAGAETVCVVNFDGTTWTYTYDRILTRDLWGIEETIDAGAETDPSKRVLDNPTNNQHAYNLQNQSWGIPRKDNSGTLRDPITYFYVALPDGSTGANPNSDYLMPSNSEQVWAGLAEQSVSTGQQPFERMYRNLYDDALGAKVSSAKGYFVIDLLRRGQGREDAVLANNSKYSQLVRNWGFSTDYTPGGPTCAEQFAGHVFFGGFPGQVLDGDARSPNLSNYLFFSQLITVTADVFKCYQAGDPTSRDSSDVVDTDGGFVRISGAQDILAIRNLGTNLVIFASNGVWVLTGGTVDSGFSATNYKVNKISNFGIVSANSIIVEGSVAYFWARDGIYQVGPNSLGDIGVESITLKTIQRFYQAIPNTSKINCVGNYDEINKKLRWIYIQGDRFDNTQVMNELILDTALGAFTYNLIANAPGNVASICGLFQTRITTTSSTDTSVLVGSEEVYDGTTAVVMGSSAEETNTQYVRYATLVNSNGNLFATVSYYKHAQWRDWGTVDGVGLDSPAFLQTGDITGGDSSLVKQVPYLTMTFERTENGYDPTTFIPLYQSSCKFRSMWAFANEQSSNKWSPLMQAYRYRKVNTLTPGLYDTGFSVIQTKNKVRGSGRAFSLYFETEPYYDCRVVGWNLALTVNPET